jgi:hypothetical protein
MSHTIAPTLKMFGLQRTCTNVVLKGLLANFYVVSCEEGREWKHGKIGPSGEDIQAIVCCFREPLAWLVSMYRWSFSDDRHGCPHFNKTWSFAEFLVNRHYDWLTPLDRWNEVNRHYLEWLHAHSERGIAVRSEDMMSVECARQQYLRIGVHFSLRLRSDQVRVFTDRVDNTQILTTWPMNYDYYTQRQYLSEYTDELRSAVIRNVDQWVVNQLGYNKYLYEG